jgi:GH24 family phage-related lysozyme (muramidase)/murein DD-endopeptidase MepM/ murein hydrolase activator NlpD
MTEFDDNQTAVEYGESLLANRAQQQRKNKKRQKKIQRVGMVLAGINIADKFMAKNAQKKVETFTQNLNSDKAHAINTFNLAKSFKTNELDGLQKVNPGLDYTNANSWNLTLDDNGKVLKAGAVYNALKKEYAENLRADYGIGTTGNVLESDLKRYREDVEKQTVQAYKALQAKYAKFKPSLGTSEDLIKSQYEQLIAEGSKEIMSARNTSSVRKLLSKFGIADSVDKDLQRVEMGGVNLYLSKELIANQTARKQAQADATARYEELIAKRGDAQIEVDNDQFRKGLSNTRAKARSMYSNVYANADLYTFQVTGKGKGKAEIDLYGNSTQNPYLEQLDNIDFTHPDSNGQKQALLSAIPTEGEGTITYSQLHNRLIRDNRIRDLNEITLAYDLNIQKIIETRQLETEVDDPSMIRLSPEDFARAKYDAVMDLVTISGDEKTIKVTPYSEFINQQAVVSSEAAETRSELVSEGNKLRPEVLPNGEIRVTYSAKSVSKESLLNTFQALLEKDIEDNQGQNLDKILEDHLEKSFPITLHGEVFELYNSIITPEERGPLRVFEMSTTPYGGGMLPMGTVVEGRKKKMIDRATQTEPTESFLKHLKMREGFENKVYLDSLGKPTVGVGHLLTEEQNKKYKVGDIVPDNILDKWLEEDSLKAWKAALKLSEDLDINDLDFIDSLASVNFQLGTNWFKIHKNTWKFLQTKKYDKAANEAQDSTWFKQTPIRVQDFQKAIRNL